MGNNSSSTKAPDSANSISEVNMGEHLTIEELVAVSRYGATVEFTETYMNRVNKARALVEKWIDEEQVIYGVNTGFGSLCKNIITKEETEQLQKNIILSHCTSVGAPMKVECARSIMVMMLANMGQGYSGVSLGLLEHIRRMLNLDIVPKTPMEGSVGYLSVEAHIGLAIIGQGECYHKGELRPVAEVYKEVGIKPYTLKSKEGLSLTSGTTGATAFAALTVYDFKKAIDTADLIGAMTLEALKGTIIAFDEDLMKAKPRVEQIETAKRFRELLKDSEIIKKNRKYRLQDALSLRAIPQTHGAVKRTLSQSWVTVEEEMNMSSDNPIIFPDGPNSRAISGCHCDATYVGIAMDSVCTAATVLGKMSERRNFRLITEEYSEMPDFLVKNPGLNSGLMIPHYSQAGLLNDMRSMVYPSTVDNIPTSGGQEDYVSMGYNACKKAYHIIEKLEYILSIELLSVFQSHLFLDLSEQPGSVTQKVLEKIKTKNGFIEEDKLLSVDIENIKDMIHQGCFLHFLNNHNQED